MPVYRLSKLPEVQRISLELLVWELGPQGVEVWLTGTFVFVNAGYLMDDTQVGKKLSLLMPQKAQLDQ